MERESFEDKLKSVFDGAELSPSDTVWTNLELKLAREEAAAMKQRLLFFKMLAAASIMVALLIGGYSLYYFNQLERTQLATTTPATTQSGSLEKSATKDADQATQNQSAQAQRQGQSNSTVPSSATDSHRDSKADSQNIDASFGEKRPAKKDGIRNQMITSAEVPVRDVGSEVTLDKSRLRGMVENRSDDVEPWRKASSQTEDPVQAMLQRLTDRERQIAALDTEPRREKEKEKQRSDEALWTSLGFAAGTFNTSGSSGVTAAAPATLSAATAPVEKEAKASGQTYSLGVNVGKKLADRWVVQGGVSYLTQLSDYTAQAAITSADFQSFRPVSTNELEKMNQADAPANSKVVSTAPYNVNNNVKYLSVPVQAGYLVLDRKFGLQLNAGVATDIFLQNSKTADGENIDKISEHIGEESPYRPMNFSGLVGTELSYKFGDRYRLALNPGVRYPINSIYKSSLNIQANPITFDIGLRFRYIFQ